MLSLTSVIRRLIWSKEGSGKISFYENFDMHSSNFTGSAVSLQQATSFKTDFKWEFGPNRYNLQLLGLWCTTSDHKARRILSNIRFTFIFLTMILSCVVPCILALMKVWGDFHLMIENLQYTLPLCAAAVKLIVLWWKREVLAVMNDMVLTDWRRAQTDTERSVMKKWARISRMITISGNILMYTAIVLAIFLPWCGLSIRIASNFKSIDHRFVVQSYFFYDMSKTMNFAATYLAQAFGVIMSSISYTGVDNYLIVLIFHICGQFHNLNIRILNLGGFKDFRCRLAYCVQEHIRLLRFVEIIDDSFTMMLLVLLVYFGIIFCFYGFIVISQVGTEDLSFGRMFYTVFAVIVTFSHMCLFCVIGEILVEKSDAIFYTSYDYEWYTLKPQDARCLIYLMIRASKPSYITAGKLFPVTMATFCSLLKTSGGYISVLLANQSSESNSK